MNFVKSSSKVSKFATSNVVKCGKPSPVIRGSWKWVYPRLPLEMGWCKITKNYPQYPPWLSWLVGMVQTSWDDPPTRSFFSIETARSGEISSILGPQKCVDLICLPLLSLNKGLLGVLANFREVWVPMHMGQVIWELPKHLQEPGSHRSRPMPTLPHICSHLPTFCFLNVGYPIDAIVYQYFAHENNNKTGIWRNAGQTQNIILLDINRIDYPSITPLLQTQETISVVA